MSAVLQKPDTLAPLVAEIRPVGAKTTTLARARSALGDPEAAPKVEIDAEARNDGLVDNPGAACAADEFLGF